MDAPAVAGALSQLRDAADRQVKLGQDVNSIEEIKQRERKNIITALMVGALALLSFVAFFLKVIG